MFWQYLFKRKNFINSLKKVTFGIRDGKAISFSQFGDVKVEYPDFDEQKHIAITLNKIDDTIQLHERKCEELTLIKKSLLQKLFPKEDKIKPEIRYKNFSDAWEQRKLGEVATFINGRAYKQNELLDSGKYKVLRVGNFYTNDSWYYSNLELADKYYIDEGDLVYTWSATFGPHIWNGEKVIYHYHIWKIELSKFLDRDFTLQILEADKAKLLANTNGSTMIHVTKKDMESKVISLPNIEEQKKIGSYLMKFDSLITLHQRKLEKLKQLKKFLLQNMFI
ncbi:restriction endonuclease subunit S [Lactobacillus salivarius]|nr:restriction endonuclease subunit S [Ligilactobacillus salivarius]NYA68367.1 restriction endonuclease subunit S [Ligilactobacillus salivarius]NYA73204.1 restriction endonuclease subunit S [Ligilactobacillus salivarius]